MPPTLARLIHILRSLYCQTSYRNYRKGPCPGSIPGEPISTYRRNRGQQAWSKGWVRYIQGAHACSSLSHGELGHPSLDFMGTLVELALHTASRASLVHIRSRLGAKSIRGTFVTSVRTRLPWLDCSRPLRERIAELVVPSSKQRACLRHFIHSPLQI
jgi:hypothetical protein